MALLKTFVTLALISGALLVLLPEGSLRRTAAVGMGRLLTLCWAEGLMAFLAWPSEGDLPDTALAPTGMTAQELMPEVTRSP